MSVRCRTGMLAMILSLATLHVIVRPASAESEFLNPDVGSAEMALDVFMIRGVQESDAKATGVALMYGLSTRATALVQLTSTDHTIGSFNHGLVVEGRLRIYIGGRNRHETDSPHPVDLRSPR